jgi:hypothetical protein
MEGRRISWSYKITGWQADIHIESMEAKEPNINLASHESSHF